jgi:Cu+-exporting ATPase
VLPLNGATKLDVTRLASSLASHSAHPLSQAVAALVVAGPRMTFDTWEELRGSGLLARESTSPASPAATLRPAGAPAEAESPRTVRLGSLPWLRGSHIDVSSAEAFATAWTAQGATVLGVARGQALVGVVALKDPLKPGAREVVARLQRDGLTPHLVTGDQRATALAIAQQAGIAEEFVFAGVRPEAKADLVRQLQARGLKVAFVGDGINDAPALEQADLGVAVSRASDVARDAADIVLLKSEIEAVPESIGLARATLRTIKQNLFWAFFYNALGIPLAALGLMSPILCAAAMGVSDLVVIGNALRLLRWRDR